MTTTRSLTSRFDHILKQSTFAGNSSPLPSYVIVFALVHAHGPWNLGRRDGSVLRALVSHQCGSGLGVICGLSLLLALVLTPRGFTPGLLFSPLLKNQHFQIPIRSEITGPQVCQSQQTVKYHPR